MQVGVQNCRLFVDSWFRARNKDQFLSLGDVKVNSLIEVTYAKHDLSIQYV
jgi:hypothetical protein